MKHFAVLILSAGVFWSGSLRSAADGVPLPTPTGMAPTVPQVPVPVMPYGSSTTTDAPPRTRLIDRLGFGSSSKTSGPRIFGSLFNDDTEPFDTYPGTRQWCANCAPSVRYPLPPLPANVGYGNPVRPASATQVYGAGNAYAAAPGCANGSCGSYGSGDHGSCHCWHKFTGWLFYRQTPNHFPIIPTTRVPESYTLYTTRDGAPYGPGCAGRGCASGNCAGGPVMAGNMTLPAGTVAAGNRGPGGVPCPQAGAVIMPGYRLANTDRPQPTSDAVEGQITSSSYRVPAAGTSQFGTIPAVRPFPQQ